MEADLIDDAIALLEKANANLDPDLLSRPLARRLLEAYSRVVKLGSFGVAALAPQLEDVPEVARVTGTSVGKAKETIATGKVLESSGELTQALQHGDVSLDQASEIARAEEASPGTATELLSVAREESFHVLKERARKAKLEAERQRDLFLRQRAARGARNYSDELGMVHIHLSLEPHVGTPIVALRPASRGPGRTMMSAGRPDGERAAPRYLPQS